MGHISTYANQARRQAGRSASKHSRKLELMAKAGWLAKGSVYATLGVLAVLAAVGSGGELTGSKGALAWVAGQPFGRVLLLAAGVGLAGYALWRLAQAILDPGSHPDTKTAVAKRLGWATSGMLHVALSVASFQMFAGSGGGSSKQTWLAQAMSAGTWGVVLVGAIGVAAIGAGLFQFKKAAALEFMDEVRTGSMSRKEIKVLRAVGRAGHAARGIVFPIIGGFIVLAAVNHDPSKAKGMGGALSELAQTSWIALAVIAVGLTAYGVLQFFFARYRGIRVA